MNISISLLLILIRIIINVSLMILLNDLLSSGYDIISLESAQLFIHSVHPLVATPPRTTPIDKHDNDAMATAQVLLPSEVELLGDELRSRRTVSEVYV